MTKHEVTRRQALQSLSGAVLGSVGLMASGRLLAAEDASPEPKAKPAQTKPAAEEPKLLPQPALTPELTALRDRVRKTLALYFHQPVNTADNTPGEILLFCLVYGCDTEVRYGDSAGNAVNGVGCLCWNYPCAGYQILTSEGDRAIARVGYGLQAYPSQMLAVLAQSAVPVDYEIRIGPQRGTVADLVESEQLDCRSGSVLSAKLVGLAHYVPNGKEWKNQVGETWSVGRVLEAELERHFSSGTADATRRLMALSYAVERQRRLGKPLEGDFRRAESHVAEYQDYAFRLQNSDGSWHPRFFAARGGAGADAAGLLCSTGHIAEWLAYSLPDGRLRDPGMVRPIAYLTGVLENYASRWNATATTPQDFSSVMHALDALRLYDRRVFKPADRAPTDPPASQPAAAAKTP